MEPENEAIYDVVVSHSTNDSVYANELVDRLEQDGLRCWIAPRDIGPGTEYGTEIVRGLRRAKALVLLLSDDARTSRHVLSEVERAFHLNHTIFWLKVEDVEPGERLEYFLSTSQGIDAFHDDRDVSWDRLSAALQDAPMPPPPTRAQKALAYEPMPVGLFQGWRARMARIVVYTILGWMLINLDPLGLGTATNQASERVLANVLAPLYGDGFFRSSDVPESEPPIDWNEHITVLLFEDAALEATGSSWPVPPEVHADILWDLYESYTPSAIMIDMFFMDRRANHAEGLKKLQKTLKAIHENGPTRIYLAGYDDDLSKSDVLPELQSVATLVAASWLEPGGPTQAPLYYPLGTGAGLEPRDDPGPAYVIYRDLCEGAGEERRAKMACPDAASFGRHFREPMQLFWGVSAPRLNWEQAEQDKTRFLCRATRSTLLARVGEYIQYSTTGKSDAFPQTCPYSQLILVKDFVDDDFRAFEDVKAAFGQALVPEGPNAPPKIVFYGGDLRGVEDKMNTYTHGQVPGVYAHAMALDNLLTLGGSYVRFGTTALETPFGPLQQLNLVLVLFTSIVSVLLTDLRLVGFGPKTTKLEQAIGALVHSPLGGIFVAIANLAIVLFLITIAVYIAFVQLQLASINWIGFLGMVALFRFAESGRFERTVAKVFFSR